MGNYPEKRVHEPQYLSPGQTDAEGFETLFEHHLKADNTREISAKLIHGDEVSNVCFKKAGKSGTGRKPVNPGKIFRLHFIRMQKEFDFFSKP